MRDPLGSPPASPMAIIDQDPWFANPDILDLVFTRMEEGSVLGRCSRVCKEWKVIACGEKYWKSLTQRRWCVNTVKQFMKNGPMAEDTSKFWKKIYTQWHKSCRQPSSSFSGHRFPAFAVSTRSTLTKKFERFHGNRFGNSDDSPFLRGQDESAFNVSLWCNVSHSPNCAIENGDDGTMPCFTLHLVVQNFGEVPISISPEEARLRMVNNSVVKPSFGHASSLSTHGFLAIAKGGRVNEDPSKLKFSSSVLQRWEFAVLELRFAMPYGVHFEPEALERCTELTLVVSRADEDNWSKYILEKKHGFSSEMEGLSLPITAKFDESKIWRHYSQPTREFWVFTDRPDLKAM